MVEQQEVKRADFVYLLLNKPRGLVVTASDEAGRPTVFQCLEGARLPRLVPVGRLDQASEGLLLLTNDTQWANAITAPESHLPKIYHVQVHPMPDSNQLAACLSGIESEGENLRCTGIRVLRSGEKNAWLEIVLEEGRNRHVRRMLAGLQIEVLRLIRIAIGPLQLGNLPKGKFRLLPQNEARQVTAACRPDRLPGSD